MPWRCMSLHPLRAHPETESEQVVPNARPAIGATGLGMDGFDVQQQSIVTETATLRSAGAAHEVLVLSVHADTQHPALHRDGPHTPVALDEGVLQFWPFARYAAAFPRISRSIFTRASGGRGYYVKTWLIP